MGVVVYKWDTYVWGASLSMILVLFVLIPIVQEGHVPDKIQLMSFLMATQASDWSRCRGPRSTRSHRLCPLFIILDHLHLRPTVCTLRSQASGLIIRHCWSLFLMKTVAYPRRSLLLRSDCQASTLQLPSTHCSTSPFSSPTTASFCLTLVSLMSYALILNQFCVKSLVLHFRGRAANRLWDLWSGTPATLERNLLCLGETS